MAEAGAPGNIAGARFFRYDTFGDEQLWTGVLRMHEVLAEVAPATALAVGLKVDVEALTREIVAALKADDVDLDGSGCNARTAAAECRRRRAGQDRQRWPAGQRGHHLRPVPFHG